MGRRARVSERAQASVSERAQASVSELVSTSKNERERERERCKECRQRTGRAEPTNEEADRQQQSGRHDKARQGKAKTGQGKDAHTAHTLAALACTPCGARVYAVWRSWHYDGRLMDSGLLPAGRLDWEVNKARFEPKKK